MDITNIPTGLGVPTQIPLDTVAFNQSESLLSNLGTDNFLAYKYYEGLVVHCINEDTTYKWREVESGEENTGLIAVDFTYPNNHIVYDIDYSNRVFNFFPYFKNYAVQNVGAGVGVYKDNTLTGALNTFNFKTLTSNGNTVTITNDVDTINLEVETTGIDTNFGITDITFTGDRVHDLDEKIIHYNNAKQVKTTVNTIQVTNEASIEEKGYGSSAFNIIKRIYNGASEKIVEIFGNKSVKFYGNVWSNGLSNEITNTVFGENALLANTTGEDNVAIGFGALQVSTTARACTAVGLNALNENISGNDNTALGIGALPAVKTGIKNTAIGSFSGGNLDTSSSYNLAIGTNSLVYDKLGDDILSATNCISIGVEGKNFSTTPINEILIGNNCEGRGNNTILLGNQSSEMLYIPEHTTTEINAFTGMVEGAMVYNVTLNTICFYNGTTWQKVTSTNM